MASLCVQSEFDASPLSHTPYRGRSVSGTVGRGAATAPLFLGSGLELRWLVIRSSRAYDVFRSVNLS